LSRVIRPARNLLTGLAATGNDLGVTASGNVKDKDST
jgi:hypothetical protein